MIRRKRVLYAVCITVCGVFLAAAVPAARAQQKPSAQPAENEDHKAAIMGLEIGMTPQQVMDRLERRADNVKDAKDEVILYWKLKDGDVLQVSLRRSNERVSFLGLHYGKPRATTDLYLQPLGSPASRSDLTLADSKIHREYRASETNDKMRTVWIRDEKAAAGYRVEVSFLSGDRKQYGSRFEEFVEFKYVSVAKEDLSKFDAVK